jgi:hypothetical protein
MGQITINGSELGNALRRDFYVYVLFRPWDGSPCYIGKGHGSRWKHHEQMAASGKHYNKHLAHIVVKANGELPKVKIRQALTSAEACEIEIAFIKAIGRQIDGGPLVNLTDGGDGKQNYVTPPETREKIRQSNIGKKHSDETRALMSEQRRVPKSPRHVANQAASQRGKIISEEHRSQMREAAAERWAKEEEHQKLRDYFSSLTEEERAKRRKTISERTRLCMSESGAGLKISVALTGRVHDEERRKLTSVSVKKAYEEKPEFRRRNAEHLRQFDGFSGRKHSAETRARMSASQQARADRLRAAKMAEA